MEKLRNPNCTLCPLHEGVNTVCLWGTGNTEASLMFVGEAPGADEDTVGRPFVGKAGELLTNILAEYKINRSDVYISNSVKCRPPKNRRPHVKEIRACKNYLLKEIEAVNPKLIVGLGQVAMATLLDLSVFTIGSGRQKIYYSPYPTISSIPIIATYHPAALLRDPTYITPLFQDLEFILGVLKNGIPERKSCHYYKGVSPTKHRVSVDLETDGLNPFLDNHNIICIGTTNKPYKGYCTTDLSSVRDILSDKTILKIGHNIKFDIKWILTHGLDFHGPIHDTMVGEHIIDENAPSFGLKELASIYTDMGPYSAKFEKQLKLVGSIPRNVPIKTLMNYCAQDVDAAMRMYLRQVPIHKEQKLETLFALVMAGEKVMAKAEIHGVQIDKEKHKSLQKFYKRRLISLREDIKSTCGVELTNPDSPTQLAKILTGKLGLPILRLTKGGKVSVDKYALEELRQFDSTGIIRTLLRYRQLRGDYSKYLAPGRTLWQSDGRVHANFNIHGTDTGRYSCVNPNLQQVPRESPIKKLFVSSFKRGKIISFDYDQGELRILAHMSQDKHLLKAFKEGQDIHRATASQLFHTKYEDVSKEQRYAGKTINFGIMYGMGISKLAFETGMSDRAAARFLHDYMELHDGVKRYKRDRENEIEEQGYVTSLFHRRRRIPIVDIENRKEVRSAHRKAVNAPIQGGLHELNILSMVELDHWLVKTGARAKIILAVHDQVLIDSPADEVQDICRYGKDIFENPDTSRFGFEFIVPMTVTVSVGDNWKEVVEIK